MLLILGWVRKWGGTHPQGLEIKKAAPIFLNKNKVWRGRGSARQAKKQDYPDFSKLIYQFKSAVRRILIGPSRFFYE